MTQVVVISIDGLNPKAITRLGSAGVPALHGSRPGASTLNARTERESTMTLPNHTGMVTGRPVDPKGGSHGVVWNDERTRPATVHRAAGHEVASIFTVVHDAGLATGLFASKLKFELWNRSWPDDIDVSMLANEDDGAARRAVRTDSLTAPRALRFVHFAAPDTAGHAKGFLSPAYLAAVRRVTAVSARSSAPSWSPGSLVDHGGRHLGPWRSSARPPRPGTPGQLHGALHRGGAGVAASADLYDLNPDYRDPGRRRTSHGAQRPPVRNGDVANLVTHLLGLDPVSGSRHGATHDLDVTPDAP